MGDLGETNQSDGGGGDPIPYPDVGSGADEGGDDNGPSTTKEVNFDVGSAEGDDAESGEAPGGQRGIVSPTNHEPSTFASFTDQVLVEGSPTTSTHVPFGHGADPKAEEGDKPAEPDEKQEVPEDESEEASTFYDPSPPPDETESMDESGDWKPFGEPSDDVSFGVENFDDAKSIDEADGFDEIFEG